jgi:hypothetical protein
MNMKNSLTMIKQTLIGVLLGGLVSVLPFYYETKAMTLENGVTNLEQDDQLAELTDGIHVLDRDLAIEKTQQQHNSEALIRIEKKLDDLIRVVKTRD